MNQISLSLALRRRAQDDRGIALVVVVALMALIGVVIVTLVSLAIYESRASGRDRQRSSAVMTAEGQVDTLVSQVQTALIGSLPCSGTVPQLPAGSDIMSLTNTVKYFTAAGVEVQCAAVNTGTVVASATIKSTSTSQPLAGQTPAVRTVETLLKLTPTYQNSLNKAIFGNASVTLANQADIFGEDGKPNADVYTNGNVTCNNNQHYYGSIYAQGNVSMSNTCTIEVDVWAGSGITATNPGVSIKGKALAVGNIDLGPASLGQQARASGTVVGNICTTTPTKCISHDSPGAPPSETFPTVDYAWTTTSAWEADGYMPVSFPQPGYECGMYGGAGPLNGKVDNVGKWLYDHTPPGGTLPTMGKTLIASHCPTQPVKFQGVNLTLPDSLVIFSDAGFNFSGNTTIKSSTTDHRYLYLIQPSDAHSVTTSPCTSDGISLDNQVTVEDTVDDLLYSPCSIRKANNSTQYGQIYAGGNVEIDNKLTMYYKPLPLPDSLIHGHPIEYYSADILYKRENNP
jgi:Tfp pilus assembly protein PilX